MSEIHTPILANDAVSNPKTGGVYAYPMEYNGATWQRKGGYTYTHLTANGNSDGLKTGPGVLHGILIGTKGATGNTLTLQDATAHGSGTFSVIDTTSQVGFIGPLDLAFTTGLSAILATGTAADVTLIWK